MERRLLVIPANQKVWIKTECKNDFDWDSETHEIWRMIINVVSGEDDRYLPCDKDNDFTTTLHLFRTQGRTEDGRETEKMFSYIQETLNCLLYETADKEYYELSSNISNVLDSLEEIERIETKPLEL